MTYNPASLAKLPDDQVVSYFQAAHEAYLSAEAATSDSCDLYLGIGGYTVRVQATTRHLLSQMTLAMEHLVVTSPGPVDLTIKMWDSASTQTPAPPSPLAWYSRHQEGANLTALHEARFTMWGGLPTFHTTRMRASFHVWPHMLRMLDLQQNLALCWIDNARHVPVHEAKAPFREILSWWVSTRDLLFVHAGAVGTDRCGVLIVGKPGAGKSTTALACLSGSLAYAGDDYCLVATHPAPRVYSLYNSAKLKGADDLRRFPHFAPLVQNTDRPRHEEALMFLYRHYPDQVVTDLALRAILIPTVTKTTEVQLTPAPRAIGLSAMAPSTAQQLPASAPHALRKMGELVRLVPCYTLEVGPDIAAIAPAIRRLLSSM